MQIGSVLRFNKIKGYGFIKMDGSDQEIFVHFSEINKEGYKELVEGQRVRFVLAHGERGEYATQVTLIDSTLTEQDKPAC